MEVKRQCSIDGCDRKRPYVRGLCTLHYRRWRKGNDLNAPVRVAYNTPEEAFDMRTEWQGDCLVWVGALVRNGYGQIWAEGKHAPAHRFAWEQVHGPIPEGLEVDHLCHTRACCNVDHLRLATREENMANRAGATKRSVSGVRNVCPHGNGWRVQIGKNGKNHLFGTYPTIEEAAAVAEKKRAELFGDVNVNQNTPS